MPDLRRIDHSVTPGIEHDPEKWKPVFGEDHAPQTSQSEMTKSSRFEPGMTK
jgi:hypothetical protein